MPEAANIRPEKDADPSVRRITVARFEDPIGLTASVVDFNKYVETPTWTEPQVLSHIRHFDIPVQDALLEAWAVFERDLLSTAVWLGIASAPMTKNSWRNLVAMDRSELIEEVASDLLARNAPLAQGFEDRAVELKQLRDRIASRKVVYQPIRSDFLVLYELTGPGRGVGDLIPYAELHEAVDIALRLGEVLRSSVVAIGGDPTIFEYQTEYSAADAARLAAEIDRIRDS
jgi:hypothetical protein